MDLPQLKKLPTFHRHVQHPNKMGPWDNNFKYDCYESTHKGKKRISKKELMQRTEEALAWLRSNAGYSPFGFVFTDGTYDCYPSNECLGLINCTERICRDKPVAYFITAVGNHKSTDAAYIRGVDWLINRSPYAKVFVTKDAKSAIDNGVIMNTEHNVALNVASAAIYRNMYGIAKNMSCWWDHIPEDIAFLFAHYFHPISETAVRFSDEYDWSSTLGKNIGVDGIKRFVTRDCSLHDTTPMRDKPYRYGDFMHLWRTTDSKVRKPFKPKTSTLKVTHEGWGGKQYTYTYENAIDLTDMKKACDSLMEQIGYPYAS